MNSTKFNVRKISFFVLFIAAYLFANFIVNQSSINSYLTDPWEISDSTHSYTVNSLSSAKFKLKKGDSLTLKTTLPEYSFEHPMIKLWFYHSAFSVKVDNETIYESGIKEKEQKQMVPNGTFFVALPDNAKGKVMEICFSTITSSPFTSLPNVAIQNEGELVKSYFTSNSIQIAVACFLLISGILLITMKLFSIRKSYFSIKMIFISSICVITSFWLFFNGGLNRNIFGSIPMQSEAEYLLLYVTPILICGYIKERQQNAQYRKICKLVMLVLSTFLFVTTTADLLHIFTLADVLVLFHVIAFFVLGLLLFFTVHNYMLDHDYSERLFLFGMATMIVLLIVDIVKFNVSKYVSAVSMDNSDIIVPVSILILVFSMLVSSVESILRTYQNDIESKLKDTFTSIDSLTGLSNHSKSTEYLDASNESAAVIIFDITNLKQVNELYGHSHGDIYLKSFADCLKNVFEHATLIGRIGDDEFVVVLPEVTKGKVKSDISYLADLTKVAVPDATCPLTFKHSIAMNKNQLLWTAYEDALSKLT